MWKLSLLDEFARREHGIAILDVGSTNCRPGSRRRRSDFYVSIRAEDVTLEKGRAEQEQRAESSTGHVSEIAFSGVLMKVT